MRRVRLVSIIALSLVAIGVAGYLALDHLSIFDSGQAELDEVQRRAAQMAAVQVTEGSPEAVTTPEAEGETGATVSTIPSGPARSTSTITTVAEENPFLPHGTPQTWALAVTASQIYGPEVRHDRLTAVSATAQHIHECKASLSEWWGVHDRADLLEVLDWLAEEGHREVWVEMSTHVADLGKQELKELLDSFADDSDMKHRIELAMEHSVKPGSKTIVGWDFMRYVGLCRDGYLAGYLGEAEAWDFIMPAAAKLQAAFASWEEMGENYLLGREFWSYQQALRKNGPERQAMYEELLSDPLSPWKENPWDMDLGVAPYGTV